MARKGIAVCCLQHGALILSVVFIIISAVIVFSIAWEDSDYLLVVVSIFCYGEGLMNWFATLKTVSTEDGQYEEEITELWEGAHYCQDCLLHQARLTHHCSLCRRCVRRHDHHCFFVGTCIGGDNQSHFVVFCLYTGIGTMYLSWRIYQWAGWSCSTWYDYPAPFMPFGFLVMLRRSTSVSSAGLIIFFNVSMAVSMACLGMVCLEVYLMATNKTWHQFSTGTSSSKGRVHPWKQFWTSFGLLNLVVPLHNRNTMKLFWKPFLGLPITTVFS